MHRAGASVGVGMSQAEALEALQASRAPGDTPGTRSVPGDAWAEGATSRGQVDSWKDLYRVLVASLRTSSKHFEALTLETLALGWMGLSKAHEGLRDDIPGACVTAEERELVDDFIYYAHWASAFDAGATKEQLAAFLSIPVANVAAYQPESAPMRPAHYVAVDTSQPFINLVVRGTTTWHDAMTDLVAHNEPLGSGHVHSGMLEGARAIIHEQLPLLEQLLQQHIGYRVHCIGHSLGGGVAALIAYLLRTTPAYSQRLATARGAITATGFGTPPVMTPELAEACRPFCRTVVYNHDMVPRTCVATLDRLQRELEEGREAVFSSNATLGWLRDSGALATGKAAAQQLFAYAASANAARLAATTVTKSPAAQQFVQAGLSIGASFLTQRLRQLHVQTMGDGAPASAASASGRTASSSAGSAGAGAGSAAEAQQLRQADTESRSAVLRTAEGQRRYEQESQAATVQLYSPGELLHLTRDGLGEGARYHLRRAPPGGPRFGRIVLARSMLRDHYLSSCVPALQQLLRQMGDPAPRVAARAPTQVPPAAGDLLGLGDL